MRRVTSVFEKCQQNECFFEALLSRSKRKHGANQAFADWKMTKDKARRKTEQKKMSEKPHNETNILSVEDKDKNYHAWIQKKNAEIKRKKNNIKNIEIQDQHKKEMRQQKANAEYEKWLATAKTKPKFVPMGQGLLSIAHKVEFSLSTTLNFLAIICCRSSWNHIENVSESK